jgi:hypothetical protein
MSGENRYQTFETVIPVALTPRIVHLHIFEMVGSTAFTEFKEHTAYVPKHLAVGVKGKTRDKFFAEGGNVGQVFNWTFENLEYIGKLAFPGMPRLGDLAYQIGLDSSGFEKNPSVILNVYVGFRNVFGERGFVRSWTDSALKRELLIASAVKKTLAAAEAVDRTVRVENKHD